MTVRIAEQATMATPIPILRRRISPLKLIVRRNNLWQKQEKSGERKNETILVHSPAAFFARSPLIVAATIISIVLFVLHMIADGVAG